MIEKTSNRKKYIRRIKETCNTEIHFRIKNTHVQKISLSFKLKRLNQMPYLKTAFIRLFQL